MNAGQDLGQDPYQELALDGLAGSELPEHLARLNDALLDVDVDQGECDRVAARQMAVPAEIRQREDSGGRPVPGGEP